MDFTAPTGSGGMLQCPDLNLSGGLNVAIGASSVQSAAIQARAVFLSPDQNCWVTAGFNPTASVGAGSFFLPQGAMLTLPIQPGWKIAVIQTSAAGNLPIVPCTYPN